MLVFIYKLTIEGTDYAYVGSTTNYSRRILDHKSNMLLPETHKAYNYKIYKAMREYGIDRCKFDILETFECEAKQQRLDRETHWLTELFTEDFKNVETCLNSIIPISYLNKAERCAIYYQTHKDARAEYKRQNAERIKEYDKKKYAENSEKIKEHAKQYYVEHREEIRAKSKQKRDAMEPVICECGIEYTANHKNRHMATLRHKLGTDETYRLEYEEEQKRKKEEQHIRRNAYKAQWLRDKTAKKKGLQ